MIQLKSICKSFEGRTVLDDINFTFENGKTNLIIGQSGSGKTVLMKCIVGLLTPEKGEVLYDNRNLLGMGKVEKKTLRKEMGMIFQSAALFDSLSVLENVMFPLDMFSNDTYRDRVKRAQFCLDRVNLLDAQNKYPGEISGGMQKRVAIARAIALNPQYLFCTRHHHRIQHDNHHQHPRHELSDGYRRQYPIHISGTQRMVRHKR